MTNIDSILKSRDITLPTKVRLVKAMVFPAVMYECESWFFQWSCMNVRVGLWRKLSVEELMLLNCVVGEDSWESLELQGDPTNPSKDQSWVFSGRTDAKAETPVLWAPHVKSWLIGKDPDAGRNCSTQGLPVRHQHPEFTQTHVHRVGDAIQPSHPLSSPSAPTLNLSQHQGLFKWVSSSHQVTKVLEFQLQHQSFQ